MKITPELFKRFNIDYDEELEFSKAIVSNEFPLELFHYIREYYHLTDEEFKVYCNVCSIKDCENFWRCTHTKESKNLFESFNVNTSVFVRNSSHIKGSINVFNSIDVTDCWDIAHSKHIQHSSRVIESQDISDSDDITRSSKISWSKVILNSTNLDNCNYTYMSDSLIDCHFCGFMKNSRHCMFCVGLEDKEYYIFNKPVTQIEYEMIKDKLLAMLEEETSEMIRINFSKHTAEERFKLNRRFDSVFNGLSLSFYGWVGTLPNYSDNAFVDLFFRDRETVK